MSSLQNQLNKILHYFQKPEKSAQQAKERLQIIIAHERGQQEKPDYLPSLQKDLLAVISKYVAINQDDIRIELDSTQGCSILELNVVLPAFQEKETETV